MNTLKITSPSFHDGEQLPLRHQGKKGISPAFHLENIPDGCQSIVMIMENAKPSKFNQPYWLIWDLPVEQDIPENIPHGPLVASLNNAIQGASKIPNRYAGPKARLLNSDKDIVFRFYALDIKLNLLFSAEKHHLLKAMETHILSQGQIHCTCKK